MTPSPLPDAAARIRAVSEIGRSMLVEAGAGTGKTTLIADRAVELLAEGRAAARELAVITFTEAAARQLETRIRERLRARLARERAADAGEGRAHRIARLEQAASELDRASIQTIHAFAAAIVRRRPVEARVDPRFTIIDGETRRTLLETAWSDYVATESSPGSAALREILEAGVGLEPLRAVAVRWADHRDVPPDAESRGDAGLPPRPDPLARARALARTTRAWAEAAVAGCRDPSDRLRAGLEAAGREAASIAGMEAAAAAVALSAERPGTAVGRKAGRQRSWRAQDALDRAREHAAAWPAEFGAYRREHEVRVAARSALWIKGYLEAYEDLKRRDGLLDFQDLLLAACRVLSTPAAARDLSRTFRAVLVDEFQDTDPLQVEIVRLLTGSGPEARGSGPRPGAIFIVGDPKQSIYRFRRADSEIYRAARAWIERGPEGSERAVITANFRCRPGIVAWVNAVFERLLEEYAPIASSREAAPGPPVSYVPTGSGSDAESLPAGRGGGAEEARVVEARALARVLARELEDGGWSVEGADGAPRRAVPGDVVLLFRAFGDVAIYEDALREAGVRCRTHAGRRYFARPEVAWFASLLRAVEQPHDEIAVVAALRSPWLAASDGEILAARLARGRLDPLRVEPAPPASGRGPGSPGAAAEDPVASALRFLAESHRRRNEAPVGAVVERLLFETGAIALGLARAHRSDGAGGGSDLQGALNLEKVAALARRHEAERGTFRSFVRWLGRAVEEEVQEAEAPVLASEDDSVRLMTIHAAKGLEFPIVVLADLARKAPGGESFVVDRDRGQAEIRLSGSGGRFRSAGFERALEKERDELVRERQRLFYVAATRARDHLVLVLPPPLPAGRPRDSFLEDLARADALPDVRGELADVLRPLVRTIHAVDRHAPGPGPDPRTGAREDVTAALPPSSAESVKEGVSERTRESDLCAAAGSDRGGGGPADQRGDEQIGGRGTASWSSAAWRERRRALVEAGSHGWRFLTASRARAEPADGAVPPEAASAEPADAASAETRDAASAETRDAASAVSEVEEGVSAVAEEAGAAAPWIVAAAARARSFGLAVHAVLENVDLRDTAPGGSRDLAPLARAAALACGDPARARDVESTVRRALDLPTMARARARRSWREAPVALAERGVMLEGQIDLAYEEDDGSLVIVDFKTDGVADQAEAARRAAAYRAQLALYALALERGTHRRVSELVLLFVSAGIEVRLPYDAPLRELAEQALADAAAAAAF